MFSSKYVNSKIFQEIGQTPLKIISHGPEIVKNQYLSHNFFTIALVSSEKARCGKALIFSISQIKHPI